MRMGETANTAARSVDLPASMTAMRSLVMGCCGGAPTMVRIVMRG